MDGTIEGLLVEWRAEILRRAGGKLRRSGLWEVSAEDVMCEVMERLWVNRELVLRHSFPERWMRLEVNRVVSRFGNRVRGVDQLDPNGRVYRSRGTRERYGGMPVGELGEVLQDGVRGMLCRAPKGTGGGIVRGGRELGPCDRAIVNEELSRAGGLRGLVTACGVGKVTDVWPFWDDIGFG